jgi:cell division septation protein DedD
MSNTHIRHTRRSKHYMSPVLLDHSTQKKLVLSMVLALVVVFLSGYVVGFKKAEVKLASFIDTVALDLPVTATEFSADMEPQRPMLPEPGETIDVDSVDEEKVAGINGIINVAQASESEAVVKPSQIAMKMAVPVAVQEVEKKKTEVNQTVSDDVPGPLAIGGPSESDPGQEELLIQDTATEESAAYSIQVGMYGQLSNAEQKVDELIATDLSAYLTDYMNKKNEIRYNVRFGYFADRSSAREALATYEKELSGSGYIVRLQRQASTDTGS